MRSSCYSVFFFNDTATTEIYTLSLHDALPILADKLLPDVNRGEILTMATRSGGEALGLQCGKLACGQQADLIGFRVSPSYSGSWFDVPFESHRHEVDFYMVDGKSIPLFHGDPSH